MSVKLTLSNLIFLNLAFFTCYGHCQSTFTWTGDGPTNNWSDAANWDLGAVPGVDDEVIHDDKLGTRDIVLDQDVTIRSFTAVGPSICCNVPRVILSGHEFTVTESMNLFQYLFTTDGVVKNLGNGFMATTDTLLGAVIENYGTLEIGPAGAPSIVDVRNKAGGRLVIAGQVGAIFQEHPQTIVNEANGILEINGLVTLGVENHGMLQATISGFLDELYNSPTASVFVDGVLTIERTIKNDGVITVAEGGSLSGVVFDGFDSFGIIQADSGTLINDGEIVNGDGGGVILGGEVFGTGEFRVRSIESKLVPEGVMFFRPPSSFRQSSFEAREGSEYVFALGKDIIRITPSPEILELRGEVSFEGEVLEGEYQLFDFSTFSGADETIELSIVDLPAGLDAEILRLEGGVWVSVVGNSTYIWTGSGPTDNWSDPGNWDRGSVPGPGHSVIHDLTGSRDIVLDQDVVIQSLTTVGPPTCCNVPRIMMSGFELTVTESIDIFQYLFTADGVLTNLGDAYFATTDTAEGARIDNFGTLEIESAGATSLLDIHNKPGGMLIVGSQVGSSVNENVQVIINEPGAVLAIVDVSVFQLIENFGMLQTAGGHIENLNNNPGGMVFVDGILTVGQVINEGAISVSDLGSFGSIGVGNDFLLFQSAAGKLFNEGLVTNLNETSVSPRIRGGEIHGNGEFQIGFVASRLVPETNMSFHPTTNDNGFRSRQDSEFVFELGKDLIQIVGSGLEFLDLQGSVCFEGEVQVGEYQLFEFSMADSSEEAIGISLENVPDGLSAELLRLSSGLWVSVDVEVLLGDVNMDGMVDLLDIAPFVDLLTNLQYQAEADINQDGNVDLLDVTPFVGLLSGS